MFKRGASRGQLLRWKDGKNRRPKAQHQEKGYPIYPLPNIKLQIPSRSTIILRSPHFPSLANPSKKHSAISHLSRIASRENSSSRHAASAALQNRYRTRLSSRFHLVRTLILLRKRSVQVGVITVSAEPRSDWGGPGRPGLGDYGILVGAERMDWGLGDLGDMQ